MIKRNTFLQKFYFAVKALCAYRGLERVSGTTGERHPGNLLTLSSEGTENSLRFLADAPLIPAQVDYLILADGTQIPLNG